MNDTILDEIAHDVFERPKSTIDLDYLNSLKAQVKDMADDASSRLKRNVYENYSLFIESSKEISNLKNEMRTLNTLIEQQQDCLNKLLDQLNKNTLIQENLDRPKFGRPTFELNDMPEDMLEEIEPNWLKKVPEDLDILIAQHEFEEGVELAKKVKRHLQDYPSVKADLRFKIDSKLEELVNSISSKPAVMSIKLLRELNMSSRAVKIYLNKRSSLLRERLKRENLEPTLQSVAKISSIFFKIIAETCQEFRRAFDLQHECEDPLNFDISGSKLPSPELTVLGFWMIVEIENFCRLFSNFPNNMLAETIGIIKDRSIEMACGESLVNYTKEFLVNTIYSR